MFRLTFSKKLMADDAGTFVAIKMIRGNSRFTTDSRSNGDLRNESEFFLLFIVSAVAATAVATRIKKCLNDFFFRTVRVYRNSDLVTCIANITKKQKNTSAVGKL